MRFTAHIHPADTIHVSPHVCWSHIYYTFSVQIVICAKNLQRILTADTFAVESITFLQAHCFLMLNTSTDILQQQLFTSSTTYNMCTEPQTLLPCVTNEQCWQSQKFTWKHPYVWCIRWVKNSVKFRIEFVSCCWQKVLHMYLCSSVMMGWHNDHVNKSRKCT